VVLMAPLRHHCCSHQSHARAWLRPLLLLPLLLWQPLARGAAWHLQAGCILLLMLLLHAPPAAAAAAAHSPSAAGAATHGR
jgi:hypothetical protein